MGEELKGFKINKVTGMLESDTGLAPIEYGNDLINPADEANMFTGEGYGEGMSDVASSAFEKGMTTTASLESAGGFGDMFSGKSIGSTMQGIGAIAGAAAGIYDAYNKKKYQDKVFGMEDKRIARETERQDKQQAAYDKVFG